MENRDEERAAPDPQLVPPVDAPAPQAVGEPLPPAGPPPADPTLPFENALLAVADLPRLDEQAFTMLAPAYRSYNYVVTTLLFSVLFGTYLIVLLLTASWPSLPWLLGSFLLWGLLYGGAMWLVHRGYLVAGYALRTHDISFRRGVIFRKLTVVPFNRVQHCEVQEGPFERTFGLASLLVYTAGGHSSDLSIGGLLPDEARRLKDYISTQTAAVDED